jgi:hypothetical protein
MKKQPIAATFLAAAVMVSLSACGGQSNSAQTPQSDTSTTTPSPAMQAANAGTSTKLSKEERAKKREEIRQQVEAVLTPEQLSQYQAKVKSGEKMRQALQEVNLTADQQTKIQDILKAAYPHQQASQKN